MTEGNNPEHPRVLKSGVHATLAGVAMALTIPMRSAEGKSPPSDNGR